MTHPAAAPSLSNWTKSTFYLFFEPLLHVRATRQTLAAGSSELRPSQAKSLRIALELISYNYSNLIEYIYLSSQKHKALRVAVNSGTTSKHKRNLLQADLIKFLNARFFTAMSKNFSFLHSYFEGRSANKPRICIKGNFKTENRDAVITIFRDSEVPYPYEEFGYLDDNTGLLDCYRTGRYFLSNDIVSDVLQGQYQNPRIDKKRVKDIIDAYPFFRRNALRGNWLKVWNSGSRTKDAFQSTLVVPITLSKNQLSEEFITRLGMETVDRIIFGFLCIDHPEQNYFDKVSDVPFGYAIADIISLYAFTRLQFTDFSSTFCGADTEINDDEVLGSISAAVKDAVSGAAMKAGAEDFSVEETQHNRLIADDSLVDLIMRATSSN